MVDKLEISFHLNGTKETSGEYEFAPVTGEHTLIESQINSRFFVFIRIRCFVS